MKMLPNLQTVLAFAVGLFVADMVVGQVQRLVPPLPGAAGMAADALVGGAVAATSVRAVKQIALKKAAI